MLADVILPLALHGALTYRVPDDLAPRIRVGQLVIVPVKRKHYTAIVLRTYDGAADPKMRDVAGLVEPTPLVTADQLRLWRWMAQYYMCTPGEVAKAALPAGFKDEEKMSRRAVKAESDDQALLCAPLKALPEQLRHQLSPAQQRAAAAVLSPEHEERITGVLPGVALQVHRRSRIVFREVDARPVARIGRNILL